MNPLATLRHIALVAACFLLAATLLSCTGGGTDPAAEERMLELEAKAHSLEESLESLSDENARLREDLAALGQRHDDYHHEQEEAAAAKERELKEESDYESRQEGQLGALEEGQTLANERLDSLGARLGNLEEAASQIELVLPAIERWFKGMEERLALLEGTPLERTVRLAEAVGGQAQVINFGGSYGAARSAVLVLPAPLPEGEIPLIVSLHGFGGNSADHALYVPLHERVNRDGFALLMPNGTVDPDGNRFWNPTAQFGDKQGNIKDDVGALTALVEEAGGEFNMGPVYFFGYSNGGFMSYLMACQGLPGLRAVASLAGTSYVDDATCEGAPPVSVLHIHGEKDRVVRFHGSEESQLPTLKPGERYAGAKDMYYRWGERAGCDTNSQEQGEYLVLDAAIEGEETFTYRFTEGCAEGITVEMWSSDEGGHAPAYGDAFADALLDWLLAQK